MAVDLWSAIIGAGAGVTVAAITTFGPALSKIWLERRASQKQNFTTALDKIRQVYGILNDVVARLGSKRAMILYTENNGGVPQVGCQLYVTIVNEVYNQSGLSIRDQFQRFPIDLSYTDMLAKMLTSKMKKLYVVTDQLPPSLLRQIYEEAGTKMSLVYVVKETKSRLYYASFNFPHSRMTAELDLQCDLQVNRLRGLFERTV